MAIPLCRPALPTPRWTCSADHTMSGNDRYGELVSEDHTLGEDPLQPVDGDEMDESADSHVASSSDAVELNDMDASTSESGSKKKKKKRTVKKKRKVVKRKPTADGVDQAPVNPDDLGPDGEHEEGYQTYDPIFCTTILFSLMNARN